MSRPNTYTIYYAFVVPILGFFAIPRGHVVLPFFNDTGCGCHCDTCASGPPWAGTGHLPEAGLSTTTIPALPTGERATAGTGHLLILRDETNHPDHSSLSGPSAFPPNNAALAPALAPNDLHPFPDALSEAADDARIVFNLRPRGSGMGERGAGLDRIRLVT